jgi:hypothetical protein
MRRQCDFALKNKCNFAAFAYKRFEQFFFKRGQFVIFKKFVAELVAFAAYILFIVPEQPFCNGDSAAFFGFQLVVQCHNSQK